MTKQRADILLAEQGIFHSRSAAQRAIMAGLVSDHNHQRIDKSGTKFPEGEKFYVKDDGKKYVSRGGFKLEKALKVFDIDLKDKICLDIGASTGGFTDVALQNGAKMVYAALILYYTLESDKVALKDKAMIIGALGYLISPLDVIPDAIPIAGLSDDLAVLIFVLHKVWGDVSEDAKQKAHDKLAQWFDEDELPQAEDLFKENPEDTPV